MLTASAPGASGQLGAANEDGVPPAVGALVRAARPVQGAFGSGHLLRTRLLSVLVTDDGRVYVGAVTPAELLRVAAARPAPAS